jgi:hypothetical protein
MINTFFLAGEIKKVTVSEPKDPKKAPTALLLVQYGPVRESTGGPVEFVNAVPVRVPGYKYPSVKDKLKAGKRVQITGHLQGVFRTLIDEGSFTTELVADRVYVEGDSATDADAE